MQLMRAEIRTGGPTQPDTRITVFGFIYLGVVANPFHDESCRTKTILANHSYASLAGWTFYQISWSSCVRDYAISPN